MIDPDYFLRVIRQNERAQEQRDREHREEREQRRQRRLERQRQIREGLIPVRRGEVLRQERPVMLYRDLRYHPDYDAVPMDDGHPPIPVDDPPIPIPMEVPVVIEHPPQNDPPMSNEPVANETEPHNFYGVIDDPRIQRVLEGAIPLDENGRFDLAQLLQGRGVMRQPEEFIEPLDGRQFFVPTRDPDLPLPDTPEQTWFVTVNIPGYTNQYPVDVLLLDELRNYILEGFEEYPSIPDVRLTAYNNGRSANLLITTGQNYIELIKQMDFYFPESLSRVMDPNLRFTTEDIFNFQILF